MTTRNSTQYPKLRAIDPRPLFHNGQPLILLRDPLQLTDRMLVVPQPLAPVLAMCDGTREDGRAISLALALRFGIVVDPEVIEEMLSALDELLLLENDNFARACDQALSEYRSAPFRQASCAGRAYPDDKDELRAMLKGYLDSIEGEPRSATSFSNGRGVISPHIDYARGGQVYARVWKEAEEAAKEADLVVLFGTDHYGGGARLTLTKQNYSTPFGVLPTARDMVDAIARCIGEEEVFRSELSHRGEHSIELAAVWLHYIRGERPVELVPILCGSFADLISRGLDPESDSVMAALVDAVQSETAGRKVLVVAAADLAHIGPAFGGDEVDREGRERLKESDDELIERMCAGDWRGFFEAIRRVEDCNNVCGVSPIYLALRVLGGAAGKGIAYDRCPADDNDTSFVSVCGVVLG